MEFRIAETFTDSLARLTGEEQEAVETTAFDLQLDSANPGTELHNFDRAKDKDFWSGRVNRDLRPIVHETGGAWDDARGRDPRGGLVDPSQRHVSSFRQAEVRADRREGHQSPGRRGDEGVPRLVSRLGGVVAAASFRRIGGRRDTGSARDKNATGSNRGA